MKEMLKFRFWLITCAFILGIFISAAQAQTQKPKKEKPGKTVLIFEKKQCFGSCPVYTAEFFADGLVKVNGIKFVKKAGLSEFRLYPEEICNLYTEAQSLGFFSFPEKFETQITDYPQRELTLYKKNKPKRVVFAGDMPSEFQPYLKRLAELIEKQIN